MEKLFRKVLLGLILVAFSLTNVQSQIPDKLLGDAKYGVDTNARRTCLKNITMYRESYKQRDYDAAIKSWRVVYNVCPKATKRTYVDGATMYKFFVKKQRDPMAKLPLIDTLMKVYDARIINFNEKGVVLGKKGNDLISLNPDAIKESYDILTESMNLLKEKTHPQVIFNRYNTAYELFMEGEVGADLMVNLYIESIDFLNIQLAKAKKPRNIEVAIENIEKKFMACGAADCKTLIEIFTPKLAENPTNVDLLKKITTLLTINECEGSDLFAKASESLYKIKPSATAAENLAKLFQKSGEYDKAAEYYTKAFELETDNVKKAKYYVTLGNIYFTFKQKPQEAREYARKALQLNSANGEAYILIGLIYTTATNYGTNPVEKNSVYWLAVDYFNKAKKTDQSVSDKANEYIKKYKVFYPTVTDIFFYFPDSKEGDSFKIGSWINETTTIRPGKSS